ncbi:MAG: hypothetical protein OXL34_10190 [Gemmatimonadota bacterium]|nr:hypothetical protein [Gemmatimonadota bacterium]
MACRLVIEGGFHPDRIRPRPPIAVERNRRGAVLHHDPDAAIPGRRTIFGGLTARKVDVTVTVADIGPMLAVSLKGTHFGFDDLVEGLEGVAGGCVNLHMAYPALVYGFWHVVSGNDNAVARPVRVGPTEGRSVADILNHQEGGELNRYRDALRRLSERRDLRDDPSHYEACGLTPARCDGGPEHCVVGSRYPDPGSVLDFNRMFRRLYSVYDRRFVFSAPELRGWTEREVWHVGSPLLTKMVWGDGGFAEMEARVGVGSSLDDSMVCSGRSVARRPA